MHEDTCTDHSPTHSAVSRGFEEKLAPFVSGTGMPAAQLPASIDEITPRKLVFYCKRCRMTVAATQTRKKYAFRCKTCGSEEVSYGTQEGLHDHYRLMDDGKARGGAKW